MLYFCCYEYDDDHDHDDDDDDDGDGDDDGGDHHHEEEDRTGASIPTTVNNQSRLLRVSLASGKTRRMLRLRILFECHDKRNHPKASKNQVLVLEQNMPYSHLQFSKELKPWLNHNSTVFAGNHHVPGLQPLDPVLLLRVYIPFQYLCSHPCRMSLLIHFQAT